VKPRFEKYSYEATKLLEKAAVLERRIEKAVEGKDCPDCKGGKLDKAGMCKMGCKMEKAEKCPCGSGKPTAKCCPNLQKAQPGFKTTEPIKESSPHFVSETGGQTQNQHFTTNQRTLETEDAPKSKNKKGKENVSMEGLGRKLNPHEGTGVEREDASGESKPLKLD